MGVSTLSEEEPHKLLELFDLLVLLTRWSLNSWKSGELIYWLTLACCRCMSHNKHRKAKETLSGHFIRCTCTLGSTSQPQQISKLVGLLVVSEQD